MKEIRELYNRIPCHFKDFAEMPYSFHSLGYDEQNLFLQVYNAASKTGVHEDDSHEELLEELGDIVRDLNSTVEGLETIIEVQRGK